MKNLHEKIESEARKSYCIIDGWRQSSKHPIQGRNAKCRNVYEHEVYEELGDIHIKTRQEVLKPVSICPGFGQSLAWLTIMRENGITWISSIGRSCRTLAMTTADGR
jgi:hypothetical protein